MLYVLSEKQICCPKFCIFKEFLYLCTQILTIPANLNEDKDLLDVVSGLDGSRRFSSKHL